MNNAIAPFVGHDELETIQRIGKLLAASGFFDAKGDGPVAIAQMATKILAGRELGFGPFAAVNGIHIIQGKPAVGANLMASAVKAHPSYDYRVRKMDNTECAIEFFQLAGGKPESLGISTFNMQDAQAAGVTANPTWKKFPRNMNFARAMSNGVRWYCPDVFNGNAVYVPEELGATVNEDGDVIEVEGRKVEVSTGEVQEPAEDADRTLRSNAPAVANPITAKTSQKLNIIGSQFYTGKGEWDATRPQLVTWVTQGQETSSKQLSEAEGLRLIAAIERKREKAQAAKAAALPPELPVEPNGDVLFAGELEITHNAQERDAFGDK